MVYTEGGTSAYVTDNPNDLVGAYRALPLYTAPPQRQPLTVTKLLPRKLPEDDRAITALETALAEPQPEPVAPPQRQPLTDMEIARLCVWSLTEAERIDSTPAYALARAIEKAHGIGGDK
jgi:hypothetical protein